MSAGILGPMAPVAATQMDICLLANQTWHRNGVAQGEADVCGERVR